MSTIYVRYLPQFGAWGAWLQEGGDKPNPPAEFGSLTARLNHGELRIIEQAKNMHDRHREARLDFE